MRAKKKRTIKLRFKLIMLACFLIYTGYAVYAQQINIHELQQENQTLTEQQQQAEFELNRLEHQRRYMGTDKYVEDAAREKFGLTYEDEIILEPQD